MDIKNDLTFVDPAFYQDFLTEYDNWIPEEHACFLIAVRLYLFKVSLPRISEFIGTKSCTEVEKYIKFFQNKIDQFPNVPGEELAQIIEQNYNDWTEFELTRLMNGISEHGTDWPKVAENVATRN